MIDAAHTTGTDRVATTVDRAAIIPERTAKRSVVDLADLMRWWVWVPVDLLHIRWAAEFFPIAGAKTARVIAAFTSFGAGKFGGIAAIRTAFAQPIGANTGVATSYLLPGTRWWFWGRRRTASGVDFGFQQNAATECRASQSEQTLEYRTTVFARGQCFGNRIETTIVHISNSP